MKKVNDASSAFVRFRGRGVGDGIFWDDPLLTDSSILWLLNRSVGNTFKKLFRRFRALLHLPNRTALFFLSYSNSQEDMQW